MNKHKSRIMVALVAGLLLTGCTQPEKATSILEQQGYTDITIVGARPWMKSHSDAFSTGFTATSPRGDRVSGAVTYGMLKGYVICIDQN